MSRKKRLFSPEPIELEITGLYNDGRGTAEHLGKLLLVEGSLPGEKVIAEIKGKKKKNLVAKTTEVLVASPDRVEPACPNAEICSGCCLHHQSNDAQILAKQARLQALFAAEEVPEPEQWIEPLLGPKLGYRNKARLGVRYVQKKEKLLVGFREKNGRYVAELDSCPVLTPAVGERLLALRELIGGLDAFERIAQIEVSAGDTQTALVVRHLDGLSDADQQALIKFGEQHDLHMYLQPGGLNTVHKVWPADNIERLSYALPQFNLEMLFHPMDFTQVNAEINQKMIHQALEWLQPKPQDTVLDLFCGLGNFTLPIARKVAAVVGVEGSESAVSRADENVKHNQIGNAAFHYADLFEPFAEQPWAKQKYDALLIDPPRSGAEEVANNLHLIDPDKILYVSCNPTSLARDAKLIANAGYKIKKAGVLDMFPHTAHVESMVLFERI
ncbi:MAG: 23S rRNA (uracil(1939)-C(5))-methyltransferase RlmD [Pseudomonadales bacterium]|nr:23S rRNA (uracil(1939)-C(5))-methyltransferase RlmD [Pseudomonadales bacterium]